MLGEQQNNLFQYELTCCLTWYRLQQVNQYLDTV